MPLYSRRQPFERMKRDRLFGAGGIQGINPDEPILEDRPEPGRRLFRGKQPEIDEYGIERPAEQSGTSKIMNTLLTVGLPLLAGAATGVGAPLGAISGLAAEGGRRRRERETKEAYYQKSRERAAKLLEPTGAMKTFQEYQQLDPGQQKEYLGYKAAGAGAISPSLQFQMQKYGEQKEMKAAEEARGARLPANQAKDLGETASIPAMLDDLEKKLEQNKKLFGPLAGRIGGANPYAVETQKIQASINMIKQRVGKALEGGVLRKEDEEKYKKILAQLTDVPEVAISKLREVRKMISNQYNQTLDSYKKSRYDISAYERMGIKKSLSKKKEFTIDELMAEKARRQPPPEEIISAR